MCVKDKDPLQVLLAALATIIRCRSRADADADALARTLYEVVVTWQSLSSEAFDALFEGDDFPF